MQPIKCEICDDILETILPEFPPQEGDLCPDCYDHYVDGELFDKEMDKD